MTFAIPVSCTDPMICLIKTNSVTCFCSRNRLLYVLRSTFARNEKQEKEREKKRKGRKWSDDYRVSCFEWTTKRKQRERERENRERVKWKNGEIKGTGKRRLVIEWCYSEWTRCEYIIIKIGKYLTSALAICWEEHSLPFHYQPTTPCRRM